MTREEAIEILKAHHMWTGEPQEIIDVRKENKALEMAIKALSQEPCDDAISRDAVLDALLDYWHDIQFVDGSGYDVYEDCKAVIDELPSVTQKQKMGHWLKTGQSFINPNKFRNFCCTECSHELDEHIRKEPKYCPNCGAKMEREDK